MFKLTWEELKFLKSQLVTSSWGGLRKLPLAFAEQAVAMLSSVLGSKRGVHVNIAIIIIFVKLRQIFSTHKELAHKLKELEQKVGKNSEDIQLIFQAIRELMAPPTAPDKAPKATFEYSTAPSAADLNIICPLV